MWPATHQTSGNRERERERERERDHYCELERELRGKPRASDEWGDNEGVSSAVANWRVSDGGLKAFLFLRIKNKNNMLTKIKI